MYMLMEYNGYKYCYFGIPYREWLKYRAWGALGEMASPIELCKVLLGIEWSGKAKNIQNVQGMCHWTLDAGGKQSAKGRSVGITM